MDSLIAVIAQCAHWAICARVRQADYDEIVKNQVPPRWDSPYYFLFSVLIGSTVLVEKLHHNAEPIEFIFDSEQKRERPAYQLASNFHPRLSSFDGFANVSYCDDKQFPPLQAADLLAWQIRRAFCVPTESRRRHFDDALLSHKTAPHTHILTRDQLIKIIDETRADGVKLGKSPDMRTW